MQHIYGLMGLTTDSIYNLAGGMYSVDVFDDNGCVNSGFFYIRAFFNYSF